LDNNIVLYNKVENPFTDETCRNWSYTTFLGPAERTNVKFPLFGLFTGIMGLFAWRNSGGIWMVWRNAGGICERKTLFRMKKEADQAGFKSTQTGPIYELLA